MYVIATAGHVDHGKSTLVRALTGMEPDRLAEEQRRGLTIDLGFAWTQLPSGRAVAFVDVPGHERFLANMLAGVGPAPAVCFVVAADQGWQQQSTDHRDALTALGVDRGIVAITRADRAAESQRVAVESEVRAKLRGTALETAPIVTVSGTTGAGLPELVRRLDGVLANAPAPDPDARVRFWVDRSFSITGSGTVVTGSLTAGTLRQGDRFELLGEAGAMPTSIRGLHSQNASVDFAVPHARVAANLRDIGATNAHRGDALITPGAWQITDSIDVRRTTGSGFTDAPQQLVVHIGTAATPARVRPFDDHHARLTLRRALPLQYGDRLVLRSPGSYSVYAGALVLELDPPSLRRRGDGTNWAAQLAGRTAENAALAEVKRRGAVRVAQLSRLGFSVDTVPPDVDVVEPNETWWVHTAALDEWASELRRAVAEKLRVEPLAPGLSEGAAADLLRHSSTMQRFPPLPNQELFQVVVGRARLESLRGVLRPPGHTTDLGEAEAGVVRLEERLREQPFAAPEADELKALGLGSRQLAAAEHTGRILRLRDGVVLLPQAPALAMRHLAAIEQPFTTSQARQALGTTRRVAIPLLEHLDERGWTRRVDGSLRSIVR
ncbi:MAG: selenocysteine-specific translation elongation factor [Leucobacter sp.]